jgi:hypothetical protein
MTGSSAALLGKRRRPAPRRPLQEKTPSRETQASPTREPERARKRMPKNQATWFLQTKEPRPGAHESREQARGEGCRLRWFVGVSP